MSKKTVKSTLVNLRRLLSRPDRWGQGEAAMDSAGISVDPLSSDAVCWCLLGGLSKVTENYPDIYDDTIMLLGREMSLSTGLVAWNDDQERKHEDVLYLLDMVIEKAA